MKIFLNLLLGVLFLASCTGQPEGEISIEYEVRFPNIVHNEAEITVSVSGLQTSPVGFRMSRTSPGRYALHEFAKNVYNVTATDSSGDTLRIARPDLHTWEVEEHDGTIQFTYTLYADHADGTYSGIDRSHAHFNMPASFIWPEDFGDEEISIRFFPEEEWGWNVATQLVPTEEKYSFTAPNSYYFLDSPTELSDFDLREWDIQSRDTSYTIRLALHHNGSGQEADAYAEMAKKVVDEQIGVFGESAAFDYGTYTFIACYLPGVYGDGMEHRNSTILTSTRPLETGTLQNLYTLSHEFIHSWNIERLRPATLEPFDFTEANMSDVLWFGEGFTSYYDDLTIRRAGLISDREYAEGLAGLLNSVLLSPGNSFFSAAEMSMQAPFVDAARSVDAQNKTNTFISYYSWGAVLGLALDLTLRTEYNLTLDGYMRRLWEQFGRPEIPYELPDLEDTLAEFTGDEEFSASFFSRYIRGREFPDLKPLLAAAGMELRKANPGGAGISSGSNKIEFREGRAVVTENTVIGSPLYEAGIDRGDILAAVNGTPLRGEEDLTGILETVQPGDRMILEFESHGEIYEGTAAFIEDPSFEIVLFEDDRNVSLPPAVEEFRTAWLSSKAR